MIKKIDFNSPPVVEVVLGVNYAPISEFTIPFYGLLWDKFDRNAFPKIQQVAPIFTGLENGEPINLDPQNVWPRIWFENSNSTKLIQIQQDYFLYNWRKNEDDSEYPRWADVYMNYQKNFKVFEKFFEDNFQKKLTYRQLEVTYVNHIEGWTNLSGLSEIFTFIDKDSKNLEMLKGALFTGGRAIKSGKGTINFNIKSGKRTTDEKLIIILEIAVKGIDEKIDEWFLNANLEINEFLVELTREEIRRKKWIQQA